MKMKMEIEKIKNIENTKDKLDYIWDYYKIPIIGIVTTIALIIYILYLVFRHVPEDILDVTLMNSSVASEDEIKVDDDYLSFVGYDSEDYKVYIGAHITIDDSMSGSARERVAAMILAEEIDVLVWDDEAFDYVKTLEASADLKNYLSESYIEKYSQYAVYDDEVLIGFSFDDTKDITKELAMKETYVGIVETATNKNEAARFIEYLLDVNYGE